jgi:hypothetical protein
MTSGAPENCPKTNLFLQPHRSVTRRNCDDLLAGDSAEPERRSWVGPLMCKQLLLLLNGAIGKHVAELCIRYIAVDVSQVFRLQLLTSSASVFCPRGICVDRQGRGVRQPVVTSPKQRISDQITECSSIPDSSDRLSGAPQAAAHP